MLGVEAKGLNPLALTAEQAPIPGKASNSTSDCYKLGCTVFCCLGQL